MVSLSSSSQFFTDFTFADGGSKLLTDDELSRLIETKVEERRSGSANRSGLPRRNLIGSVFQADCSVPSSSSDVIPSSLNAFKDCVYKQIVNAAPTQSCTPKAAQPPEDLLKTIKGERMSNETKRKDCPHVQTEAAGSSATKEDTRLSAGTCEDVTKTCPGLPRSCSCSLTEHKSQLDGNKNLGNGGRIVVVSVELGIQKKENNPGINRVQDPNSNNTEDQHDTCRGKPFCSILTHLQYEEISEDEDKSRALSSELYEDVSDDEKQCIQKSDESSEPTTGNSRTGLDEVQIKSKIPETETRCLRSPVLQTEGDGHETNTSCSVSKDEQELDNQLDDDDDGEEEDDDDDWKVIPTTILNLELEEAGDGGECGGKTSSCFINARPAPNPVPASAFSQMEVFDTPAQQERAVKCGQVSFVVPSSSSNHQGTSNILGSREELCSEAEDSCETDDSWDYSSGSESNYLTVSSQVVRNLSSSSLINNVNSDSERKNQGNQTKNFQKSSNQDVIVYIDSDDESDECLNETKSTKSSQNSENSGTFPAKKVELLKRLSKTAEEVPPALDPATAQLQGGHIETTDLCQGTAKGLCAMNKQTHSDDDVIIILSDSDDDIIELSVEAMTPSLISVNSDFWLKEHTAYKGILQDLKQSSAESSESRPESSWDKPGTSRPIPPGQISFHEPSVEMKDLTKKRMSPSETEEDNVDDELSNAVNSLCTKKKKVKLSEASGALGPVIPRLLVRVSPHSAAQVQLVHESTVQSHQPDFFSSTSSTVGSHSGSFRKKSQHSIRGETSKFKCPKKVHKTPGSKVDRSSFEPKMLASSLKGPLPHSRHSSSRPPVPLRGSSSLSAPTQSTDQTNQARTKVFSDWQKNHVPLRRERKSRGANYRRQSL